MYLRIPFELWCNPEQMRVIAVNISLTAHQIKKLFEKIKNLWYNIYTKLRKEKEMHGGGIELF